MMDKLVRPILWSPLAPILWPLLALGAALRLARPDLVAFKLDEAKFLGIVDRAASGGWPTAGGMSSWGGFHPPLRAYLLAPARWLTSDATAVPALLGFFSFLNLGAVALVGRRFGGIAGVASVALAAASPWLLHFNRALWDAPLPMFGSFALYAALRTVATPGSRWGLAVMPLLALQALTHLTAWLALLIPGYLLLRFRAGRSRWFLAGVAIAAALILPYLIVLLTGPESIGQILSARAESQGPQIRTALKFASWSISGADLQALLGVTYAPEYRFAPLLALGPFVVGALAGFGILACLGIGGGRTNTRALERLGGGQGTWGQAPKPPAPALRDEDGGVNRGMIRIAPEAEVLLAWVLIPLAVTVLLPGPTQLHYFQTWGAGAPFVLGGLGFAWLYERLRGPAMRVATLAALLAIPLVQAGAWWNLLSYFDRFPDTALGPTLGAWQEVASAARDAPGSTVLVWTDGDQPAYQDKPAALSAVLVGVTEPVFMRRESAVLLPDVRTVFISTPPRGEPTWGFGPLPAVTQRRTSPAGSAWLAGPAGAAAQHVGRPLHAPFVDGLTLEGYDWRVPPGAHELQLATFWRVEQPSTRARTADLTLFVHLEDASQQRVSQDDGLDWPSVRWAPGTRIAQRSTLDISKLSGQVFLRIGVYSRKDLQRSPRLDTGEDSVVIGPLSLAGP